MSHEYLDMDEEVCAIFHTSKQVEVKSFVTNKQIQTFNDQDEDDEDEIEEHAEFEDQSVIYNLETKGFLEILITDTGIGISEEAVERLFNPF
jgi:signal transduction histidine kinase